MEDRPRSEVPSSLSTAEEEYRDAISSLSGHQAEVPSARAISEEECARLEALGYTHCGDSPTP